MQDLTDARPQTETVTAAEVYELGRRIGVQEERTAIIALLSGAALDRPELDDAIYELRAVIKTGGHRQPRP